MNIRSLRTVPLIAVMVMALSAGCATTGTSPGTGTGDPVPSGPEMPDITVAAIPAVDLAGLYIAQDDGLFAKQGLHVTIKKIPSSQAIIAAQLKGQVDISAGSYAAYIAAQAAGARFRILAQASVLAPATRALVVAANSPIGTIADLVGKRIGVNGTNSIGTLLISALLSENGISPAKVHFVIDQQGFPAMPGQLKDGAWAAAFLAEPYITVAEEKYGEQVLADLDQGSTLNFPADGYVATAAWAHKYPKTAAAFVRAIQAGQALADSDAPAVQAAIAAYDKLPSQVTAAMVLSAYPIGAVNKTSIQRVAIAMLQFGLLSEKDTTEVDQGTLVGSMIAPIQPAGSGVP
jgi:NitT/TauT family transport system substrate-binding protein